MRHARHELADRSKALLPDHLLLQRLHLLQHAALLRHLRVQSGAGVVEAVQHMVEGQLQLGEFLCDHGLYLDRTEIARRDPLRIGFEMPDRLRQAAREDERNHKPAAEPNRQNSEALPPQRHCSVKRQ